MLIEFCITNYRSIAEEQVISLVPSTQHKDVLENIFKKGKYEALNAVALYGANASGKSNLLRAMELMDKLLYLSARSNSTTKLPYTPFALKEDYATRPTKFEITFIVQEKRYRYGVEYNRKEIVAEYLFRKNIGRETQLFSREYDAIDVSTGFKGNSHSIELAIETTRENALFLSVCDMFNIEEAKAIFEWFDKLIYIDGINTEREEVRTVAIWENMPAYQQKIREYLLWLHLGFKDLNVEIKDFDAAALPNDLPENLRNNLTSRLRESKSYQPIITRQLYGKEGEKIQGFVTWNLEEESEGTKKAFHLSGPILKTLLEGGLLVIDEIEAKMHPIMTINLLNLFLNPQTNPKQAQIIFATHDTNILSYVNLRREQIGFVEKNEWEATELYTMSDIKYFDRNHKKEHSERMDTDKEKRYLEGRYGGIPLLGTFSAQMNQWYGEKK